MKRSGQGPCYFASSSNLGLSFMIGDQDAMRHIERIISSLAIHPFGSAHSITSIPRTKVQSGKEFSVVRVVCLYISVGPLGSGEWLLTP